MAHHKFQFPMPASTDVVFDAFHYQVLRKRWDTLVENTYISGGAPCPYIGATTSNSGAGVFKPLSMTTEFVSYSRPTLAAAKMSGHHFPFSKWAASMQHQVIDDESSLMIYTYTFEVQPLWARWVLEPLVKVMFDHQTKRRFSKLQRFLLTHKNEVKAWQKANSTKSH